MNVETSTVEVSYMDKSEKLNIQKSGETDGETGETSEALAISRVMVVWQDIGIAND